MMPRFEERQSPERDSLLAFIRSSKRGIIKPYESRNAEA